jgi:hypothetical protein
MIERKDAAWKRAAKAWLDAKVVLDAAKDKILALAKEESCYGAGVKHLRSFEAGRVAYAKVPELKGVDLTPYRGAGFFKTTVSKI